jgi:Ca2+-binding RTX toxin-like protein
LIFKGTNSDADDIDTEISLTADLDSTIAVTLTTETADTAQELDLITLTGAGRFDITAADNDIDVTEIDASATTGTVNLTFSTGVDNALTITLGNTATGVTSNNVATGAGADDITGGSGNDTIASGNGADVIIGNAGDDSITGGDGVDDISGGNGNDVLVWANADSGDADIIDGGAGTDTIKTTGTVDFSSAVLVDGTLRTGSGVEQVVINAGSTVTFLGSQLTGQSIAINESGADTTNLVVTATAGTSVDLSSLTFTAVSVGVTGNAFDDAADTITINLGATATTVTGSSLSDSIVGGAGADSITAGAGTDTIDGGAGADVISGGAGIDTVIIDASDSAAVTTWTDTDAGSTLSTTGMDLITLVAEDNDVIDLGLMVTDALEFTALNEVVTQVTTNATAGNENDVTTYTGTYASGVFTSTAAADATALLIVYDADGDDVGTDYNAIVIIGVTDVTTVSLDDGTFNV